MKKWLGFFGLFLLVHLSATSQVNYTTKNGLPSNHVYRITQDHVGFIWCITDKGISKFDGHSFKNFTIKNGLPTNDIWNIRITDDNKVWFFYKGNELGYIEDDMVYTFPTENDEIIHPIRILTDGKTIKVDSPNIFLEFQDSIWNVTAYSNDPFFERQVGDQFKFVSTSDYSSITNNQNDTLYKFNLDTTVDSKVQQLNKNTFSKSSNYELVLLNVNAEKGTLKNKRTIVYKKPVKNARTHFVNGELQATGNHSFRRFDADFNTIERIDIPQHYNSHFSFKDNDGFLCLATFGNGIYKLPLNFKPENQITEAPISIIKSLGDATFVFSDDKGVYKLKNNSLQDYFLGAYDYFDIYSNANDTLINTLEYVFRKNKEVVIATEKQYALVNNKFFLYFDNQFFSHGFTAILQHDQKTFSVSNSFNLSLRDLFIRNDSLFSFNKNKVMYFDRASDDFKEYNLEKPFNHQITTIFDTDDSLTILGIEDKGLWQFKNRCFTKLAEDDMGYITTLKQDGANFWGLDSGVLVKYSKQDSTYTKTKFPYINGIKENALQAIHIDNDNLYLGSAEGLKRVSKTDFAIPTSSKFYVKQLQINQKAVDTISYTYTNDQNASLDIGLIDFYTEDRNTFEYRLMPTQSEWVTSKTGNISFFDLPPNEYTLTVRRQDNLDVTPLEIPIIVTPRWTQRLWFKIALALLFISLAVGLGMWLSKTRNKRRNKKLIQEKQSAQLQLKALRSQMNPHFVFNSLNAIQYFINQNDTENSDAYLVKFSRLVRRFFELSKEKDISVEEEIELLRNYLQLEQLRFKERLNFEIITPENNSDLKLKLPTMLIQPIVENAVNHGIFNKDGAGKVSIAFSIALNQNIKITVTDDGIGISDKPSGSKKYKSSKLIKDRLYHLNTSKKWVVSHTTQTPFPNKKDKGHRVVFNIKAVK